MSEHETTTTGYWDEVGMTGEELPDPTWPDLSEDARGLMACINALTLEVNQLRLTLATNGRRKSQSTKLVLKGGQQKPERYV